MQAQTSRLDASDEDASEHPVPDKGPMDRASEQTNASDRIVDLICTCFVEGLMHCACMNQAHPELVACIQERQKSAKPDR